MTYADVIARHNPAQSHWELNEVLLWLAAHGFVPAPSGVVLEIGAHRGGSARILRDVLKATVVTVDLADDLDRSFDNDGVELVLGRSQDAATQTAVRDRLAGRHPAVLFVDGGHRFDEVTRDIDLYVPLLDSAAALILHDVRVESHECEVYGVWAEIERGDYFADKVETALFYAPANAGTGTGIVLL